MQGTATPWYRVASSDLSSLRGDEPTEPTLIVSKRPHPSRLVSLVLAPVVDSAVIHRINLYPLDSAIGSPIHWIGMRYPAFEQLGPGARFSKVPIINGPGKLSPFTLKIEVSIVLHLT